MPNTLNQYEKQVLQALTEQAFKPGIASGHAIRQSLINNSIDKRLVVEAMASLVDKGLLERVKVVDADGLFYMAYRRTQGHK